MVILATRVDEELVVDNGLGISSGPADLDAFIGDTGEENYRGSHGGPNGLREAIRESGHEPEVASTSASSLPGAFRSPRLLT